MKAVSEAPAKFSQIDRGLKKGIKTKKEKKRFLLNGGGGMDGVGGIQG